MALIAIASDKGAPGVTTTALALAAVWPRPVLLAECDPAGGDLVYRFPAADGGQLDPRRGVLSLAVVARRGMQPQQVFQHVQKLPGGLDILAGVTNAEQGGGLSLLWGPIGHALAALPQADVIADCGRLGPDGPLYDLLAEATTVLMVTRTDVGDVIRLRDRAAAFAAAAERRGRRGFGAHVAVVTDPKKFRAALADVSYVLGQAGVPVTVVGGLADDPKGAELLRGQWGGNLDRTWLIRSARDLARDLAAGLPAGLMASVPAAAAPPAAASVASGGRGPRVAFGRVRGASGRHHAGTDARADAPTGAEAGAAYEARVPDVSQGTERGRGPAVARHADGEPAMGLPGDTGLGADRTREAAMGLPGDEGTDAGRGRDHNGARPAGEVPGWKRVAGPARPGRESEAPGQGREPAAGRPGGRGEAAGATREPAAGRPGGRGEAAGWTREAPTDRVGDAGEVAGLGQEARPVQSSEEDAVTAAEDPSGDQPEAPTDPGSGGRVRPWWKPMEPLEGGR